MKTDMAGGKPDSRIEFVYNDYYPSDPCGEEEFDLTAGQHIPVGNVTVANDDDYLYVKYETTGNWYLEEIHLYVLDYEPEKRLTPGHAPVKVEDLPEGTQEVTIKIAFEELDFEVICDETVVWLQAHAAVVKIVDGEVVQGETAYGGEIHPGPPWYGNISYLVLCCNGDDPGDPECQEETAWGGDTGFNIMAPGQWWYIFDTEGDATQTIWAGQTIDVGEVTVSEAVDGKRTITISFTGGWELQDVDEPVKIQGYEEIPENTFTAPAPGLFETYKGDMLVVEVDDYNYYAIHLDVQLCEE